MLRNGFTRFCDDPEIACCKAEKELEQLRAELTELKALAQAKADGRLTEEPCLFGDCEYRGVIESLFTLSMADNFGKTVFLTREAAEKALGGVSDGN